MNLTIVPFLLLTVGPLAGMLGSGRFGAVETIAAVVILGFGALAAAELRRSRPRAFRSLVRRSEPEPGPQPAGRPAVHHPAVLGRAA